MGVTDAAMGVVLLAARDGGTSAAPVDELCSVPGCMSALLGCWPAAGVGVGSEPGVSGASTTAAGAGGSGGVAASPTAACTKLAFCSTNEATLAIDAEALVWLTSPSSPGLKSRIETLELQVEQPRGLVAGVLVVSQFQFQFQTHAEASEGGETPGSDVPVSQFQFQFQIQVAGSDGVAI